MSEPLIDNEKAASVQADLAAKAAIARVSHWLRLAGYVALGAAGSITIALGAASYPLSGLLIRPRLKRLSQLKSPHVRDLIRRGGIEFEDITIPLMVHGCTAGG